MEKGTVTNLLEAKMMLQSVIFSSIDKKQFPYSKAQLNVFTALFMEGEMTMKQVAAYLACSQEQATRAVAPLADDGYIERRIDPANRTRVHIRLTESGKAYFNQQYKTISTNLFSLLRKTLTDEEADEIDSCAKKIVELMKKTYTKLPVKTINSGS